MAWTAPRTWVAGEKPSAATLNTHIRDNLKSIGDAWTSYTPTLGNVTEGNGTKTGAYMSAGALTAVRFRFTLGSTSAITGSPTISLPVNVTAARSATGVLGMYDSSATTHKVGFIINSGAGTLTTRDDASAALSSTNPFTWATSDEFYGSLVFEAA